MESILQFMYLGEGKFYHERMKEFIKVAKDLEVKDICDGLELPSDEAEEAVEDYIHEEEIEEEDCTSYFIEKCKYDPDDFIDSIYVKTREKCQAACNDDYPALDTIR